MSKKLMKDYPKEIQDRVKEIAGLSYDKNDWLSVQFVWDDSKEGQDFWNSIDNGNYDVFYDKYPKEENPIEKLIKLNEDCNWKTFSTNSSGKTFLDEFLNFEGIKGIEVNDPEIVSDSIVDKVVDSFKERSKAGIKKYGVTLDRDDLSLSEWLTEAQQEAMDFVLYLEATKNKIKKHGLYI